ncbi:MAG TPA: type II secretion system F family protein [Bryobacteraceae bacterium]|nr:type II secretion system F family protein [Bryobacteraceae bacterium]
MVLAIIAFIAAFLLLASVGLLLFYRNAALQRLGAVVAERPTSPGPLSALISTSGPDSMHTILAPFQNVLPRTEAEASQLQKRLVRAGYRSRSAVNMFYAAKVVVPLALCAAALLTGLYQYVGAFIFLMCGGVGFLLPDLWLGNRTDNRQLNIRLGLPEALDLMVICTEAGLGLDQCLLRVSQELKRSQPEISEEFSLVHLEQKAGHPRVDALKNLAERTDVDSVRALVQSLIQSDTFGTGIAKNMRVYSDTLRTQRRQKAEEQAAKTTIKLIFPLALFIFPTLFIVVLGPAGIVFMEGMKNFIDSVGVK